MPVLVVVFMQGLRNPAQVMGVNKKESSQELGRALYEDYECMGTTESLYSLLTY